MSPPRFSIATARFDEISPSVRALHETVTWLEGRQNRDGSWGNGPVLDKLICTCHSILFLLACGHSSEDGRIVNAITYLTSGDGASSDWTFWGFAPLMNIARYESIVKRDLEAMAHRIKTGAAPHPDQLLEISALKAYVWSDGRFLADQANDYLQSLIAGWSERNAWRDRADTTAHALSVLDKFEFSDKQRILDSSIAFLISRAKKRGDYVRWEDNLISTAYVVTSIAESWLWENSTLRDLAERASHGLLLEFREGHWRSDRPPFGGNTDIVSSEFTTCAIARSILAVLVRNDDSTLLQLSALRSEHHVKLIRIVKEAADSKQAQLAGLQKQLSEYRAKLESLGPEGAHGMSEWKFWDWIAYGSLGMAALVLAIREAHEKLPAIKALEFLDQAVWGFAPLALFALAAIVLVVKEMRRPT